MNDDLAAEIAEHRTKNGIACRGCRQLWPCLVRRLADRDEALSEAGERLYQELLDAAFGYVSGPPERELPGYQAALDAWKALQPAPEREG